MNYVEDMIYYIISGVLVSDTYYLYLGIRKCR